MRRLTALLFALGCASPGMPPGGPEDRLAPELVNMAPDSGAVNVSPRWVVFQFDEVVSERPQGVQSLERLFLISPRDGDPRVDWRRDVIAVRPRKGWRPNTVYSVTMLPGLSDLRNNVRRDGATAIFSTGGAIPDTRISGIVFDWVAGQPAPGAAVEAIAADSTVYVASADSNGVFELRNIPLGRYTVRGFLDANNNRALDPREAWDSVGLQLVGLADVELLAFAHDTIGPRINTVTIVDSVTLRVAFDKRIQPSQDMSPGLFRLVSADSAPVPVTAANFALLADSLRQAADRARQDSIRSRDTTARAADTARARRAPPRIPMPIRGAARRDTTPVAKPSRPSPEADVVLTLGAPLQAGSTYRLRALEIRGLLGNARTSDRVFTLPKAKPAAASDTANPLMRMPGEPVTPPNRTPGSAPATPPRDSTPPVRPPVRPPLLFRGSGI